MTQGDLVMSMDQLLTKPRLGTCHKFYMQPFILANSKKHTLLSVDPAAMIGHCCHSLSLSLQVR